MFKLKLYVRIVYVLRFNYYNYLKSGKYQLKLKSNTLNKELSAFYILNLNAKAKSAEVIVSAYTIEYLVNKT